MIEFAWPWLLLLLPLPLVFLWVPAVKKQNATALKLPQLPQALASQSQQVKRGKQHLWLLWLIWMLCIVAAARPQWLGEIMPMSQESREMMVAVDLSGSMRIEDMKLNGRQVSRLAMLKVLLGDFIERREGDRLGLILFANDAYLQTPMTFDRKTVQQMLDEAVLGLVGKKPLLATLSGLL